MKEIKRTRTIEETIGYEATDGKRFITKEECELYEKTAKVVIYNEFRQLMINEPFSETDIWENYGYGNEEFQLAVIEIKNADDLHTANMFSQVYGYGFTFTNDHIGKRMLVSLGYDGSYGDCCMCLRTENDLLEMFAKDIHKFFYTDDELKTEEEK